MIAGVDRFLLRELESAVARRPSRWNRDLTSHSHYLNSIAANRQRFTRMIGLRDPRVPFDDLELVETRSQNSLIGRSDLFDVYAVRWPVLDGVTGEGLLLEPRSRAPRGTVIVVPDCEQLPEALVGLVPGVPQQSQLARKLANSNVRVVVPLLINRDRELSVIADGRRKSTANHRELLYRAAYQMGRHLIGYEVQKVLALVDWCQQPAGQTPAGVGVVGYGEGGLIALCAAAVDSRITAAGISGYFNSRQSLWREPIDRNVFGLLAEFGDAELVSLIAPRPVIIEACQAPQIAIPPGGDGAPAEASTPEIETVRLELKRALSLVADLNPTPKLDLVESGTGAGPFGSDPFVAAFLAASSAAELIESPDTLRSFQKQFDPASRLARQFHQLAGFSQRLVEDGARTRADYFSRVERKSGVPAFQESIRPYREQFRDQIIGDFDQPRLPADPRTRLAYDDQEFLGYQVVIDVLPEVFLYGILLVPRDLKSGERRPVVVCQHGLEGRAESTVLGDATSYRDFAARLARRGFITFSPQHLYRGGDRFRTLQRKANPLGKSLFSVLVAQHRQLLDWLATLPFIDSQRIGFYGISYGGKSAMRIPAILEGYCLSICSSDFSDWIWRTASNRFEGGYLAHAEYEIFEFDLGNTFNYGEMAALICPRPFMVEEFHHSGLFAERSRGEFARVELLYENLGIAEKTQITWFEAYLPSLPYQERETFEFLHRHLGWPERAQ